MVKNSTNKVAAIQKDIDHLSLTCSKPIRGKDKALIQFYLDAMSVALMGKSETFYHTQLKVVENQIKNIITEWDSRAERMNGHLEVIERKREAFYELKNIKAKNRSADLLKYILNK